MYHTFKYMVKKIVIIISTYILFCLPTYSQIVDPTKVDAKSLSNTEVKNAKQALDQSGLSQEAAIQLARKKGASEQQIQDMIKRFSELEGASSE